MMFPYNETTRSSSWYYDNYYKTTTKTLFTISRRSLGGIVTYHGDFKAPTNHAYTKDVWRGWFGQIEQYYNGRLDSSRVGSQPHDYGNVLNYVSSSFEASALTKAQSDAYEKLRGSVDLSIDLVQWRLLVNMLNFKRNLVRGLVDTALSLRPTVETIEELKRRLADPQTRRRRAKRMARKVNNLLNHLADARLTYVYGVAPTMSTIHDLGMMFMNPKEPGFLRCEGKGQVTQTIVVQNTSIAGGSLPSQHTFIVSDRARVVMYFTPQREVLDNLGRISSLNPVAILYEATPFSFVLDWAWDIGGWIRDIETAFLHRNDFVGGYQSVSKRIICYSELRGTDYSGPPANGNFVRYDLTGSGRRTRFQRTGLMSAPYPVKPARQFSFGIGRQLNAIALAKGVLLRADDLLASRK